jgi:paraquat-inducible protein A
MAVELLLRLRRTEIRFAAAQCGPLFPQCSHEEKDLCLTRCRTSFRYQRLNPSVCGSSFVTNIMPSLNRHHHGLSWPRLHGGTRQVACHFCDTLQDAPHVMEGNGAFCSRCGHMLYRNRPQSLARATGYSSAALVLMAITHTFPFLTLSSAGGKTELTLWQAAQVLAQEDRPMLSVAVIFFTMVAPVIMMGGLLYVAEPLRHGWALPGAEGIMRWFQQMEPWSMLEVFLLGLIVSVLKLRDMADVHLSTGVWALGALVLCMAAAVAGIDRMELWDRVEIARHCHRNPPT